MIEVVLMFPNWWGVEAAFEDRVSGKILTDEAGQRCDGYWAGLIQRGGGRGLRD